MFLLQLDKILNSSSFIIWTCWSVVKSKRKLRLPSLCQMQNSQILAQCPLDIRCFRSLHASWSIFNHQHSRCFFGHPLIFTVTAWWMCFILTLIRWLSVSMLTEVNHRRHQYVLPPRKRMFDISLTTADQDASSLNFDRKVNQ